MERRRFLRYGASLVPVAACVRFEATPLHLTIDTLADARTRTSALRRAGWSATGTSRALGAHTNQLIDALPTARRTLRLQALATASDAAQATSAAAWRDQLDQFAKRYANLAEQLAYASGDHEQLVLARTWQGDLAVHTSPRFAVDALQSTANVPADWSVRAAAEAHLGAAFALAGEPYPALAALERAEDAVDRAASAHVWSAEDPAAWLLVWHGVIYSLLRMPRRAEQALRQRLARPAAARFAAQNRARLAFALYAQGERDEAAALLAGVPAGLRLTPFETLAAA
jgi:hypothetical protein